MKKQIILLFSALFLLLALISISDVSAAFTPEHIYWTSYVCAQLQGQNYSIVDMCCTPNEITKMIDGDAGADVFVLHYVDSKTVGSYIATHTRSNFISCLKWAANDVDKECFCYGIGLHQTQDKLFHTKGGVVPTYLQTTFSSNLIGHMAIENSFDKQFQILKAKDSVFNTKQLTAANNIVLDNLISDPKYVDELVTITGLSKTQVTTDIGVFYHGYNKDGFYNTVYNSKTVAFPTSFYLYAGLISLLGLIPLIGLIFIPLLLGRKTTAWRWLVYLILFSIFLLGLLIIISMLTNNSWQWITVSLKILPITVSKTDINKYDLLEKNATATFLKSGNLLSDDNSGLSYIDRNGNPVAGALGQAEKPFLYIGVPIILTWFFTLIIFLSWKMFKLKPIKSKSGRIFNYVGYTLLILTLLVILWLAFNFVTH